MRTFSGLRKLSRGISTKNLIVGSDGKVSTIILSSGPANVLTLETSNELRDVLKAISLDNTKEVLILTSASKTGVFSAGLDLKELHDPRPERLREYWTSIQSLFADLYDTRLATIAQMNGHAVAGGHLSVHHDADLSSVC